MGKTFRFRRPRSASHRHRRERHGCSRRHAPRSDLRSTRELCIQVARDLENASKYLRVGDRGLQVLPIYGGRPYEAQISALQKGVDVVVGTPGRLLDLANQSHLILGKVGVLVLDEADEMLDLGFLPDIERLMGMVPDKRQTMLSPRRCPARSSPWLAPS